MFPRDTQIYYQTNNTGTDIANTVVLASSTRTILYVAGNQKDARNSSVSCNSSLVYYNQAWGGGAWEAQNNYVCNGIISMALPRNSSLRIAYVERDRSTSFDPIYSQSTSSVIVSTMDASTTQLYTSNLHMQNVGIAIVLYALVIVGIYSLVRKLF